MSCPIQRLALHSPAPCCRDGESEGEVLYNISVINTTVHLAVCNLLLSNWFRVERYRGLGLDIARLST